MAKSLSPNDGGCWFCHKEIQPEEECAFSVEFDTNLHEDCLKEALEKDPSHPEARTMASEFEMDLPPDPLDVEY